MGGNLGEIGKPSVLLQPFEERRLRDRGEHVYHRQRNPRLRNELTLGCENARVVAVESDDHSAGDHETGRLDAVHLFQSGTAAIGQVLDFFGFAQCVLVWRFDADEYGVDVRLHHQLHQLLVFGEVDRCFGHEAQRIALRLLPDDNVAQNGFDRLLVADQIVIDDEGIVHPGRDEAVHLCKHLCDGLDPRPAPEDHNDIAEFAREGAAARNLQAAVQILVHRQQVPPRRRHGRHVRLVGLLVAELMIALPPLGQEARPGFLRLADEDHIDQTAEILRGHCNPGPTEYGEDAAALQFDDDLTHAIALHRHPGKADNIRAAAAFEIDLFDILVDDRNGVLCRGKRGNQREVQRWHDNALAKERQGIVHAPIGRMESGIDQNDLGHAISVVLSGRRATV